jgi:predicted transcriptional regulator
VRFMALIRGIDLRREREDASISNAQLARALAVNPSTVTRLEQATEVRLESAERYRLGLRSCVETREASRRSAAIAASTLQAAAQSLLDAATKILEGAGADV